MIEQIEYYCLDGEQVTCKLSTKIGEFFGYGRFHGVQSQWELLVIAKVALQLAIDKMTITMVEQYLRGECDR